MRIVFNYNCETNETGLGNQQLSLDQPVIQSSSTRGLTLGLRVESMVMFVLKRSDGLGYVDKRSVNGVDG